MGSFDGAAMAALFAATYPERTAALILINPVVRGRWASDYPWGSRDEPEQRSDSRGLVGERGGSRESYVATIMPGRAGDEEFMRRLASYMRLCASPTTLVKVAEMALAIDVREALPTIRAPTLVIHIDPPRRADDEGTDDVFSRPGRSEPLRRRADRARPVRRVDTG